MTKEVKVRHGPHRKIRDQLLDAVFSLWSAPKSHKQDTLRISGIPSSRRTGFVSVAKRQAKLRSVLFKTRTVT
jgi:hypothetical protein